MSKLFTWVLIAALAVDGACTQVETSGPDPQGYMWRKDGIPVPPERTKYHTITNGNIYLYCNLEPNAESCAVTEKRDDGLWYCDIYLPPGAPAWRIAHEERHRDGWTHPGSKLNPGQLNRS